MLRHQLKNRGEITGINFLMYQPAAGRPTHFFNYSNILFEIINIGDIYIFINMAYNSYVKSKT